MIHSKEVTWILGVCILIIFGGIIISSRFKHNPIVSYSSTMVTPTWKSASQAPDKNLQSKINIEPKIILFWTTYYGKGRWKINAGKEVCEQYICYLTYDKAQYKKASALMFHHRTDWLQRLPTDDPRIPSQRWVLYNRESSWWEPKGDLLDKANNLFNWTMGFRKDDDIIIPTAIIHKGKFKEGFDPNKNYLEGKTGEVTALMSACIYPHRGYESRRRYIDFLTKHGLKIDMYGKCGKDCDGMFSSCSNVLKKYKFVLAFENSLCDEYITEKPYRNGLQLGVVPVIMSGANLSDPYILPPGSFIDAGQFSSVSALVAFLKKVGSDPKLYNKYFEWRNEWDFKIITEGEGKVEFKMDYFCPLCVKLYEDQTPKFVGNVRKWYEQEKCKEYPKMYP